MEHSLHKALKSIYCLDGCEQEVVLGKYRIDVVNDQGILIEIQHSSLSAIKPKCLDLLEEYPLRVVKPLVRNKTLVKLDEKNGKILSTRQSPKKGSWLTAFEELVYFTGVFPHPNLAMEFLLVDIRETRYPGHGRRRRKRESDFQVQDLELLEVVDRAEVIQPTDLFQWLPFEQIPLRFDTDELAQALQADREVAQRIAFCLRETGAVRHKGKRGRANLYQRPTRRIRKKRKPMTRKQA